MTQARGIETGSGGDTPAIALAKRALTVWESLTNGEQTKWGHACAIKTMDSLDAFNEALSANDASMAHDDVIKWTDRLVSEIEKIKGVTGGGMVT